jgi:hypothetical protein
MSADYHQVKHMAEVYLRPSQGRMVLSGPLR